MFFHGLNCFAVMKYDNVCLTVGRPAGAPLTRKLQMWKKPVQLCRTRGSVLSTGVQKHRK